MTTSAFQTLRGPLVGLVFAAFAGTGCVNTATFDPVCPDPVEPGRGLSRSDLRDVGSRPLVDVLRGRVSGLNVTIVRGRPVVTIRGAQSFNGLSEPLVIVDGMQLARRGAEGINSVNTSDVESVEVLKDAADLAFYGMNGGAGVVRIATRRSGCE